MKKLLVLGSNGMAGHIISLYLQEQGHDVWGFARKESSILNNFFVGDATDFERLASIVLEGQFDYVINAIGLLNTTAEENKHLAVLINSYLPHFLVEVTKNLKTRIIQMSTDCVFSGDKGGYLENDLRDGQTFYDRSKALGEIDDDKNLTFRNSIIGPDINEKGIGLFNWFMKQDGELQGYDQAIWSGVTTLVLAQAINLAIEKKITGLYQLTNSEKVSKYELLMILNERFKKNKLVIQKNSTVHIDKSMVNSRIDFDFVVPTYSEMIENLKWWIEKHPLIYQNYIL